jgi:hypothetical protein
VIIPRIRRPRLTRATSFCRVGADFDCSGGSEGVEPSWAPVVPVVKKTCFLSSESPLSHDAEPMRASCAGQINQDLVVVNEIHGSRIGFVFASRQHQTAAILDEGSLPFQKKPRMPRPRGPLVAIRDETTEESDASTADESKAALIL